MDMIDRIRRLHSRGNNSEREIARITGLSRNTVAKWLHVEVDGPPKYVCRDQGCGLRRRLQTASHAASTWITAPALASSPRSRPCPRPAYASGQVILNPER
jgi:hypothetical protein